MAEIKTKDTYKKERQEKLKDFKEQTDKQSITVKDKKVTADAAGKLLQEGTREGADRVRKAMEAAGVAVDYQMDRQKDEHDKKAEHGKKVEGEVSKASDASGRDSKAAADAAGAVDCKNAKNAIKEAMQAAAEDQRWLRELNQRRKQDREASERKTTEQLEIVKATLVKTRR